MHKRVKQAVRTCSFVAALAGQAALLVAVAGCSSDDNPYKPAAAWSGKRASIPAPPTLPSNPIKGGDGTYTVYGAVHQLRSLLHGKDVTANPITITGYIVDSNIGRAPKCSIHKTGKADPADCNMEVPSFWIADNKGDTKGTKIRVVGWARNYAVICDAMKAYNKLKPGEQPKEPVNDDILNVPLPNPLPAIGAQVKITGAYNVAKTVVSDMVSEPTGGVIAYQKLETVQPGDAPATFTVKNPDCGG